VTKRQAQAEAARALATLNDRQRVVQAQVPFGEFLDEYTRAFILKPDNLSVPTQERYLSFLKNHVRPAFGDLMMAEVTTKRIPDTAGIHGAGTNQTHKSMLSDLAEIREVKLKTITAWEVHLNGIYLWWFDTEGEAHGFRTNLACGLTSLAGVTISMRARRHARAEISTRSPSEKL
jgi:hypothetical protein